MQRALVYASFVALVIIIVVSPSSNAFLGDAGHEVSSRGALSKALSADPRAGVTHVESIRPAPARVEPHGPGASFIARSGESVFDLRIPAIGLNEVVYQGTDQAQLAKGPGHYPSCDSGFAPPYCAPFDEVWPGQRGRVVIGGHRTLAGADVFRLGELRAGQRIQVSTRWGDFTYAITSKSIVAASDRTIIVPDVTERELVLVTCHPKYSAAQRLIVFAKLTRATEPQGSQPSAMRSIRAVL